MKQTITLRKPLLVNGVERKELSYDTEKITGGMFIEADARAATKAAGVGGIKVDVAETDTSLQYYLGAMAIIAENPEIDMTDLDRISGYDVMQIYRIGRNFTKGSAEKEEEEENPDSEESTSEKPVEVTQESSTQTKTD